MTVPLMIYPLLSSLLLSFVLAVEQFAIPAMVGIPGHVNVLATQLYLLTSFSPPNHGLAAAIGLALSALTGLSVLIHRRLVRRLGAATITGKSYRLRELPLGRWRWLAYLVCFGFLLNAFLLPVVALVYTSLIKFFVANPFAAPYTLRNYIYIFNSPSTLRAFTNTLIVSAGGAVLGLDARHAHRLLDAPPAPEGAPPARSARHPALRRARHRHRPGLPVVVRLPADLRHAVGADLLLHLPLHALRHRDGRRPDHADRQEPRGGRLDGRRQPPAVVPRASCCRCCGRRCRAPTSCCSSPTSARSPPPCCSTPRRRRVISISIWTFFENANWGNASALSVVSTLIIVAVMALVSRHVFRAA